MRPYLAITESEQSGRRMEARCALFPAPTEAVAGLGRLASLPNEVVMIVLQHCTIRTLFKLQRVNRATGMMVRLLPNFSHVTNTAKDMLERALVKRLIAILTFNGLRHLLTSNTCENCGKGGSSFQITKVKVLCYECRAPPPTWIRGVKDCDAYTEPIQRFQHRVQA
ncbi:hypothetical protein DL771_003003 [Monosporascus sp. 5C6A]|nr:hypothetical protein DL771_003003 [Monosporascus sp. 5C6A]